MRHALTLSCLLLAAGLLGLAVAQESAPPASPTAKDERSVAVLSINGAIGPATSRYVIQGIEAAQERGSRLVILEMDTPGGLDSAMRDIIRAILASRTPIVTYVAPSGARAASAGTYILYASHVAAMAPATNVGAATPVAIGGEPAQPGRPGDAAPERPATEPERPGAAPGTSRPEETPRTPEPGTAMERKSVNDSVAYLRSLAELRGRNAEWAEQAVRSAASLSASAALEMKVIDLVASDLPTLLMQLQGRSIELADRTVVLDTRDLAIERMEPDWRTELLSVITNPTIAYGLLLIGIYGLLLEGYNPGAMLPGVVGAISLLLALYALQILSVNYAGLALIGLGIAMIIAEFFVGGFGALALGGLIAFVIGSIILIDTDVPGLDIAPPLIAAIATAGGAVIIGIAWVAGRSYRRPVVTGVQTMIGETAEVAEDFERAGQVRFGGELWNAQSATPLRAGQQVRITAVNGLTLTVEPF
jgi:membrane-bound serine protease (ClpP class)